MFLCSLFLWMPDNNALLMNLKCRRRRWQGGEGGRNCVTEQEVAGGRRAHVWDLSGVFFCRGLDQLTEQNMAGSMWTPPSGLNNDILENSVPTTTILNAIWEQNLLGINHISCKILFTPFPILQTTQLQLQQPKIGLNRDESKFNLQMTASCFWNNDRMSSRPTRECEDKEENMFHLEGIWEKWHNVPSDPRRWCPGN